ncbi:hypothetical protein FSARC_5280 [Fusarium sarcochroum]|uniref:Uncharacterized protein n=1 Tax=Fusarium sarcochroum TaxID=1208366 RepID=A0A8H4U054_9HYPO|nr:hypothetical protein FSARC_5280 [Fusarium sarcochroum]
MDQILTMHDEVGADFSPVNVGELRRQGSPDVSSILFMQSAQYVFKRFMTLVVIYIERRLCYCITRRSGIMLDKHASSDK